jgi:hypothetical protein
MQEFPQTSGVSRHVKKQHPSVQPQIVIETTPLKQARVEQEASPSMSPVESLLNMLCPNRDNIVSPEPDMLPMPQSIDTPQAVSILITNPPHVEEIGIDDIILVDVDFMLNINTQENVVSEHVEIATDDSLTHIIQYVDDGYVPVVVQHEEEVEPIEHVDKVEIKQETITQSQVLTLPTDIQSIIWNKYFDICLTYIVRHRQQWLKNRMHKHIQNVAEVAREEGETFATWYVKDKHIINRYIYTVLYDLLDEPKEQVVTFNEYAITGLDYENYAESETDEEEETVEQVVTFQQLESMDKGNETDEEDETVEIVREVVDKAVEIEPEEVDVLVDDEIENDGNEIDEDELLEDIAEKVSSVIGNYELNCATYNIIICDLGLDCDRLDNFSSIMKDSLKSMQSKNKKLKNYTIVQINDMWREYVENIGLDIEIEQYDVSNEVIEVDEEENKRRLEEIAENVAGEVLNTNHTLRDLTYTIITENVGLQCKNITTFKKILNDELKKLKQLKDPKDETKYLHDVKNYNQEQLKSLWEAYHNEING